MSSITRSIQIESPAERVWGVLADFGNIYCWNPNVSTSHSTSATNEGVGASRHCDLRGGSIEERIVAWEDGRSLTIDIFDAQGSPSRLARATAKFTVEAANGRSIVTASLDYRLKGGLLGALMDALVARRQLASSFEQLLAGLRRHVTTGEQIDFGRTLVFTPAIAA